MTGSADLGLFCPRLLRHRAPKKAVLADFY